MPSVMAAPSILLTPPASRPPAIQTAASFQKALAANKVSPLPPHCLLSKITQPI